jgi:iron(III) transport system substrate-binding protein
MKILGIALVSILAMFASAWAQSGKPASLAELAAYAGADREKILLAGAKKEGRVVWYTSLAGGSYKDLAAAFEAKYPGIKVEVYRGATQDLMSRILAEAQARRHLVDTVESTVPLLNAMRDGKLIMSYNSPHLGAYPADAKEKADKGLFFWATARESYIGLAYNKNAIPANSVPKKYDDLLKSELKDKLGFVTSDTGSRAIAAMLKVKGEEFLRKLKRQNVILHAVSGRAMLDLVISGEVGASPTVFRNHALVSIEKGAPVEWVPMDLVPTNSGGVVIAAQSPHRHAAVLFADFLLGADGQTILEKYEYGSGSKDYGFKRWYPEEGLSTDQYEKASTRWDKLLRELGRK